MNQRTGIITAIIGIIGIAGIIIFLLMGTKIPLSAPTPGSLPPVTFTTSTPPTGDTFTIGTPRGSVQVNNFYKNPAEVVPGGQTIEIAETKDFNIGYSVPDSSFQIALLKMPLDVAKKAAEAAFLKKLGITKADACKLNVWVSVPVSVDPANAGRNLGLSFCSGAIY